MTTYSSWLAQCSRCGVMAVWQQGGGGCEGGVDEALEVISFLCSDMTGLQDVDVNVPPRHDGHMLTIQTFTLRNRLESFSLNEKEPKVWLHSLSAIVLHADVFTITSCKHSHVGHISLIRFEIQSDLKRWCNRLFDRIGLQVYGTWDCFSL